MTDLFEASGIHPPDAPLADRLRPRTLDEVVGQDHLLGEGGPARREQPHGERNCDERQRALQEVTPVD